MYVVLFSMCVCLLVVVWRKMGERPREIGNEGNEKVKWVMR